MSIHNEDKENICLSCGACCATYRVSLYWSEARDLGLEGTMIQKLNSWRICMAGTNQPSPRCLALKGTIGKDVICTVYSKRPSPCRELRQGDEKCNKARARHGLEPLGPVLAESENPESGSDMS